MSEVYWLSNLDRIDVLCEDLGFMNFVRKSKVALMKILSLGEDADFSKLMDDYFQNLIDDLEYAKALDFTVKILLYKKAGKSGELNLFDFFNPFGAYMFICKVYGIVGNSNIDSIDLNIEKWIDRFNEVSEIVYGGLMSNYENTGDSTYIVKFCNDMIKLHSDRTLFAYNPDNIKHYLDVLHDINTRDFFLLSNSGKVLDALNFSKEMYDFFLGYSTITTNYHRTWYGLYTDIKSKVESWNKMKRQKTSVLRKDEDHNGSNIYSLNILRLNSYR